MIPTYNRTAFLEAALSGVLTQDPGTAEMQIEVVDNASDVDDPEPLVRRLGGERVNFARHPRNLAAVANWNSCIERSRGEWVHILHSDDLVFPGFYSRLRAGLEGRDDVGAAFCRYIFIDENERRVATSELESLTAGVLTGFIEKIGLHQRIICAGIVVRRRVYEELGAFRTDVPYALDWEMWIRIAAHYPIWYEPEILAAWRVHSQATTSAELRTGGNIAGLRRCIEVSHSVLPPERADAMSRKAMELLSLDAVSLALWYVTKREFKAALNQFREALRCGLSPSLRAVLWLPFRIARGGIRRCYAATKKQFARGRTT